MADPGPERLKHLDEFALHDLESVRMILRGDSVVDWHRLNLENEADAHRLLVAHEFWRLNGIAVDLVFLNDEPGSYHQPLQNQALALVESSSAHALHVITRQRTVLLSLLLVKRRERRAMSAASGEALAARLVTEALLARAEADLRWLDTCETELAKTRAIIADDEPTETRNTETRNTETLNIEVETDR